MIKELGLQLLNQTQGAGVRGWGRVVQSPLQEGLQLVVGGQAGEGQGVEGRGGRGSYLDLWRGPGQGGVDREGSDVGCDRNSLGAERQKVRLLDERSDLWTKQKMG